MARVFIPRGKLQTIIEHWLHENANGGTVRMWDVNDDGAFHGAILDGVGSARAVDDLFDEEEDEPKEPLNAHQQ